MKNLDLMHIGLYSNNGAEKAHVPEMVQSSENASFARKSYRHCKTDPDTPLQR